MRSNCADTWHVCPAEVLQLIHELISGHEGKTRSRTRPSMATELITVYYLRRALQMSSMTSAETHQLWLQAQLLLSVQAGMAFGRDRELGAFLTHFG